MSEVVIPDPLPANGFKVPLRATFTGPKSAPLVALSHNSMFPLLKLYNDSVEFRVFIQRRKSYTDIERVEIARSFLTDNVIFVWKDSVFTFTANVSGEKILQELARFLQRHGVPLAESAQQVVNERVKSNE